MIGTSIQVRRIVDLADRIEADILQRNLQVGDRYLRTPETARMLGVDATVANRALQLLVKRKRLQRRPRLGTFVAEPTTMIAQVSPERVHLLASDRQRTIEAMFESGELLGLQGALPGAKIQFEVVPAADEDEYLRKVVADALKARDRQAFVLYGSTLTMQRVVAMSGLPAVVRGHLHPSVTGLPFLDSDQQQVGALGTQYIVNKKHQRLAVLWRSRMFPGDAIRLDAIRDTADAAGIPARAITQRWLPEDREAARATVEELLDDSPESLGIIAVAKSVADAAIEVVKDRGLIPQKDVTVVTIDYPLPAGALPNYPYIDRTLSSTEQGALLGQMLNQVIHEGAAATASETVPVVLRVPE